MTVIGADPRHHGGGGVGLAGVMAGMFKAKSAFRAKACGDLAGVAGVTRPAYAKNGVWGKWLVF
ncbi:MAG: hypothetical protein ACK5QX_12370 [bacterium]